MTGLNKDQDISVKALNCKDVIQEAINRNDLSDISGKALGEVLACSLMMGSGLKGDETLQISLVGEQGIKNVMAITDGKLQIRGMIGDSSVTQPYLNTYDLLGDGQIQVVRNHPTWKTPMNGIVSLANVDIPTNFALYMAQSGQRRAYLSTDILIENQIVQYALAIMVESLPGATDENIETSIKAVEKVHKRKLSSYLNNPNYLSSSSSSDISTMNPYTGKIQGIIPTLKSLEIEEQLNVLLDDCFQGLGDGIRFSKTPKFTCQCNIERVWKALKLLDSNDIKEIVEVGTDVETKCGFCGKQYSVTVKELTDSLLPTQPQ